MKIVISGKKVFKSIVIIICVLTFLSIIGQTSVYYFGHERLLGFVEIFNLDRESNIPTSFQVILIIFSALLIFLILKLNIAKDKIPRHYWITLFIMLLYMGTDEMVELHERVMASIVLHERMGIIIEKISSYRIQGFFSFSWVILGIIIALVFIIYFTFFIMKIDKRIRSALILSAFLYLFGEIIMEMFGGF